MLITNKIRKTELSTEVESQYEIIILIHYLVLTCTRTVIFRATEITF